MTGLNNQTGKEIRMALEQALQNVLNEAYSFLPYDKIYYGVITSIDNSGITCTLSIDNKTYSQIPILNTIKEISIGMRVVCISPQNEINQLLVIGVIKDNLINSSEWNIKFYVNNNLYSVISVAKGQAINSPNVAQIQNFNCWTTAQGDLSTKVVFPYTPTANIALYAYTNN